MTLRKKLFILNFLLLSSVFCIAQIEVAHVSVKDFKANGFGAFLNFSIPVSEVNYLTVEGGMQYFVNKDGEDIGIIPVLLGYRYTINKSGKGFYLEPNAGYTFGESTIGIYTENGLALGDGNGDWAFEKVAGPMAAIGLGYLFEPARNVQFNLAPPL